jgi:hypothetical protein
MWVCALNVDNVCAVCIQEVPVAVILVPDILVDPQTKLSGQLEEVAALAGLMLIHLRGSLRCQRIVCIRIEDVILQLWYVHAAMF